MGAVLCIVILTVGGDPPGLPDTCWIPGGVFMMGSDAQDARPDERPPHRVQVSPFYMSRTEVTNRQFRAFVEATGYMTTAQQPVDWELLRKQVPPGTPRPSDDLLQPGSMVFVQPPPDTSPHDVGARWAWVQGASWAQPEGPGSDLDDRWDHPVVHVSHDDALAYAHWRGGSLPTEAQWEFAARGGLAEKPFVWGDAPLDPSRANVWQGVFPTQNLALDGHAGTAPVGTYPPNGYGLFDTAGNVWEWTADRYRDDLHASRAGRDDIVDPPGPDESRDGRNRHAPDTRVHRGGSFLCHPSYCSSYRPSARMSTTPDSSMSHLGFRIVFSPEQMRVVRAAAESTAATEQSLPPDAVPTQRD
ncbi:MAG: formylglycine-generating enzyme family protein [Phycisphaerales bacterium]|nr:formylglycine-generating enzyme family protein [Phycisphaerales bacterium]